MNMIIIKLSDAILFVFTHSKHDKSKQNRQVGLWLIMGGEKAFVDFIGVYRESDYNCSFKTSIGTPTWLPALLSSREKDSSQMVL